MSLKAAEGINKSHQILEDAIKVTRPVQSSLLPVGSQRLLMNWLEKIGPGQWRFTVFVGPV